MEAPSVTARVAGGAGKGAKGAAMRRRWREVKMVEDRGRGGKDEARCASASCSRASRAGGQKRIIEDEDQDKEVKFKRDGSIWQSERSERGRDTVLPCRGPPMT